MKQLINAVRKGQGKKVIFIHGNMASAKWWRPVMAALEQDCDMLAVDLRGFGGSPDTPAEVTLADHAEDIYELARANGFERFVLTGQSLGGGVAMQFAALYPNVLTGMVLVDSAPISGKYEIDYNFLQMLVDNKDLAVSTLKETLAKKIDEVFLNELVTDAHRALPALIPNTRALDGADFSAEAKTFLKPVLVVHGALDLLMPPEESEKIAQAYPSASLKIIPDVGHNPHVEDAAAFTAVLRDFIDSLECCRKGE